ncbi:RPA-related protein RADX-like isoform X2 [Stegodyphus dumicola]|uniref:RPA-related protein RADX-like isoform X2 n=1 Tax=Stegodyphus dumicola TaxID=202533 RepID=UPI0015ABE3BF|nr:RPA-related protein RADX-like isoform X2 [Stegodyphus dumicola]
MAGSLKDLRSILREYKLISDSSRIPGEFLIISIYCYSADSNFLKALTPPLEEVRKEVILLHDLLLTDGTEKLKCFLALPLSQLVQKNVVKIGSYLQIQRAKMCYLEENLRFVQSSNHRESEIIPLVTGRKYYLNLWIPTTPYGEEWLAGSSLDYQDGDNEIQNISLLQDIADDWLRLPKPYPPIFVKVMARGNLYHYGYNKNDRPDPFMTSMSIADSSGTCMCAVFGKIIKSLYYRAVPGTVLLISDYNITKPQNRNLPRLRGSAGNLPILDMEIVVGDYAKVQVMPPDNDSFSMQIVNLPAIEFSFGNRASLQYAADESTIDIVGLVTHISLFHRFVYKYGKLHARCFVEIIDSSSHLPFMAMIYDNGLRFCVDDLHPGQVIVATHMKVCHLPNELLSCYQVRTYLKATHYTEIFTTHRQDSPYVRYPAVTAVASIIRDNQNEVDFLQSNVLRAGGIAMFLRGYKTLDAYKASFGESLAGKMIPGAYWKVALENLIHRERRCVTLGGFIIQVDYVDLQTTDSPQSTYGWSYSSNIVSRRTMFVNIKARYKLGDILPLNPTQNEQLLFPSKYDSGNEYHFKAYRRFPPANATDWSASSEKEVLNFPVCADGYYVITIASLHYQALLQCIMVPEPSSKPHPTLIEALNGDFQALAFRNVGSFLCEPPRYMWDEVREVNRTASEVGDKTFVFAIELHRTKPDVVLAHLQRAYICPPEQLIEAIAADRVA